MNVTSTISFTVQNGRICGAVFANSSEGYALEVVQHSIDLCIGRRVVFVKCNHAGSVAMLECEAISYLANKLRIAAQHLDLGALDAVVILVGQQITRRTLATTRTMSQESDVH